MRRHRKHYTDEELIASLQEVARRLGHSPSAREQVRLCEAGEARSVQTYMTRFGSWAKAKQLAGLAGFARGPRGYSRTGKLAQRFRIFLRDGFRCTYCGADPAAGARLVLDHVVPYSLGGLTLDSNLKTACFECNQGKGNSVVAV